LIRYSVAFFVFPFQDYLLPSTFPE